MSELIERLHTIRTHLRTGALGQREVWEEWLANAVAEITKLNDAIDTLRELREFDRKVVVAKLDRILEVLGAR